MSDDLKMASLVLFGGAFILPVPVDFIKVFSAVFVFYSLLLMVFAVLYVNDRFPKFHVLLDLWCGAFVFFCGCILKRFPVCNSFAFGFTQNMKSKLNLPGAVFLCMGIVLVLTGEGVLFWKMVELFRRRNRSFLDYTADSSPDSVPMMEVFNEHHKTDLADLSGASSALKNVALYYAAFVILFVTAIFCGIIRFTCLAGVSFEPSLTVIVCCAFENMLLISLPVLAFSCVMVTGVLQLGKKIPREFDCQGNGELY